MKPLVVYHAGCMDGAAAVFAAWLKFGDDAEYRSASYGDPAPTDEEVRGRDVYVLDFSYPRAELVRMAAACGETTHHPDGGALHVIDHHKTAQADLADLPFCTFNMEKSGAVLAWEYFHTVGIASRLPKMLPELFAYAQDRDLWQWRLPHSRKISAALAASGALTDFRKLIPIYQEWDQKWGGSVKALANEGTGILRAERLMVERIAATAEEVEIEYESWSDSQLYTHESMRCLAVTSAVLQSEVGDALALESARRGRDAVGAVYYRHGASGKWRVSLRSRDESDEQLRARVSAAVEAGTYDGSAMTTPALDVSAIAKSFGGGGHARAAGFECDRLPWEKS